MFAKIDILVSNGVEQQPQDSIEKITEKQLERKLLTNIFSMFFMTKAVIKHFKKERGHHQADFSDCSQGSPHLLDYSSTKGAIVAAQTLFRKRS